nr:MAG: MFS transporter [Chloroflexota bacterium]
MSDSGAGLSTLAIALLLVTGRLEVWHIYLATAFNSAFSAFQWPAYSAATTLLVPKAQLGRASGMVQIGDAVSQLISPAIAGALLVNAGLESIVIIDFATFLFAILTLVLVRVPMPKASEEGQAGKGSLLKEAFFGWKYISARAGLMGLLMVFAAGNFFHSLVNTLLMPLLLNMTTADVLGYLVSFVGLGALAGTLVMSAWGGPKRRVHGVIGLMALEGIFIVVIGLWTYLPLITAAGFCLVFLSPIVNGCSQAIWQSKVAPDVQGRVFSVRRMIAWSTMPLAYILAGPLNDKVFEPLMAVGGPLAGSIGRFMGVGPGRGTGLLFAIDGILITVLVLAIGYLNPRVRRLEEEIPDAVADNPPAVEAPAVAS